MPNDSVPNFLETYLVAFLPILGKHCITSTYSNLICSHYWIGFKTVIVVANYHSIIKDSIHVVISNYSPVSLLLCSCTIIIMLGTKLTYFSAIVWNI